MAVVGAGTSHLSFEILRKWMMRKYTRQDIVSRLYILLQGSDGTQLFFLVFDPLTSVVNIDLNLSLFPPLSSGISILSREWELFYYLVLEGQPVESLHLGFYSFSVWLHTLSSYQHQRSSGNLYRTLWDPEYVELAHLKPGQMVRGYKKTQQRLRTLPWQARMMPSSFSASRDARARGNSIGILVLIDQSDGIDSRV